MCSSFKSILEKDHELITLIMSKSRLCDIILILSMMRLLEESAERGLNSFADVLCRRTLHKPSNAVSPTDDPRSEGYVSPVVCVQVRARCQP